MVGRDDALAAAGEAVRAAAAGEARVVIVAGEAGVGKTRLVRELAARTAAEDTILLWGDCVPLDAGDLPYGAVIAALRTLPRELDAPTLERILGPWRQELARLLPELADSSTGGARATGEGRAGAGSGAAAEGGAAAGGGSQARLFELLLGALVRLAGDRPILLVIEDVHWADRATRALLHFLAHNVRAERIAIVLTYRTDEVGIGDPASRVLADLRRLAHATAIELERLSRTETGLQLSGILGGVADDATVTWVHGRAGGNPYFAEEVLAAGHVARDEVPAGLRELLLARILGLPPDVRDLVALAATLGAVVDCDVLRRASGMGATAFATALRALVDAQVLVPDGGTDRYRFRHALGRDAVYADQLPTERRGLHARAAAALAAGPEARRDPAAWSALAHHLDAAGDEPGALRASISAAHASERAYAFADAQRHLERAVALWASVEERARPYGIDRAGLLARLADATALAGDINRAIEVGYTALAALDEGADPVRAARLHERLGRWHGRRELALPHFQEALDLLPPGPSADRAAVLISEVKVRAHTEPLLSLRFRIDEALAIAQQAGAREEEARARIQLGVLHTYGGDPDKAVAHLREGRRISEQLGRVDDVAFAIASIGDSLLANGRVAEGVEVLLPAVDEVRRAGLGASFGQLVELNLLDCLLRLGRWTEADPRAARLLETAQADADRVAAIAYRANLDTRRGDIAAADALLPDAIALVGRNVPRQHAILAYAAWAELAVTRGDPVAAREVVDQACATLGGGDIIFWPRLLAVGVRAEADLAERARASVGRKSEERLPHERAIGLLDELLEYLCGRPRLETWAWHALAWAEASRVEGAARPDLWDEACAHWRRLEFPYEAAYCRLRAAEARLAGRSARERATEDLRAGHATAVRLGARPLLAEIEALARRARVPLGGADAPLHEGAAEHDLTPREVTVLERLALGRTNRQIAEELFLSRRTVDMHVRHILAKLHAANRVEAAGAARRLGILGDARTETRVAG
jgi:DNA-binding CsgD family transcriptional regulator/tetratricopeptide (TPR) repeat protein